MMNKYSFKEYLDIFRKQLLIVSVALICLSILVWNLFPTYYSCCDASGYWKISDDLSIMRDSPIYGLRTFFYPLLIFVARFIPLSLHLNLSIQYVFLSIVQLSIHILSLVAFGYITYSLTKSKLTTLSAIWIYGLDIFLLVFTNQILTDVVAVDFLVITISLLFTIVNNPSNKILIVGFSSLAGLLPMIRPSLILISISLYFIFICFYINHFRFLRSSLVSLCISFSFFLSPYLIQFIFSPMTFIYLSNLGKFHVILGTYTYKYITLVKPTPYGYAAVNESMRKLVSVCDGLKDQGNCINQILISHPLMTLKHYMTKLFAVNDQVYLVTYIEDFYTPFRYLWRAINCVFLASSFIGFIILTFKVIRNKKEYLFQTLCLIIIVASCLLPLINSVPEERFGLTFHPLFAICTSYFINTYEESKNRYSRLMQLMGFTIILSLLFQFSCSIESTFSLRLNG